MNNVTDRVVTDNVINNVTGEVINKLINIVTGEIPSTR